MRSVEDLERLFNEVATGVRSSVHSRTAASSGQHGFISAYWMGVGFDVYDNLTVEVTRGGEDRAAFARMMECLLLVTEKRLESCRLLEKPALKMTISVDVYVPYVERKTSMSDEQIKAMAYSIVAPGRESLARTAEMYVTHILAGEYENNEKQTF